MYAFRRETLRAMDRVLEDKLRLFDTGFGRTGALEWPRKVKIKYKERTDG